MNKILKNTLILTAITLIAGVALGVVYEITKEPIAKAEEKEKYAACAQVFPDADSFEKLDVELLEGVNEVYLAKIEGEKEPLGYVITATNKEGYGGDIRVSVGVSANSGMVDGIAILSISETAGLGMNATKPEFYGQFAGKKTTRFYVAKDGGEGEPIDALSGATITSRAVTGAVNTALDFYQNKLGGSVDE